MRTNRTGAHPANIKLG